MNIFLAQNNNDPIISYFVKKVFTIIIFEKGNICLACNNEAICVNTYNVYVKEMQIYHKNVYSFIASKKLIKKIRTFFYLKNRDK